MVLSKNGNFEENDLPFNKKLVYMELQYWVLFFATLRIILQKYKDLILFLPCFPKGQSWSIQENNLYREYVHFLHRELKSTKNGGGYYGPPELQLFSSDWECPSS